MEKYEGKFQKKGEETRERFEREKISFVKTFCLLGSAIVWILVFVLLGLKYRSVNSWNQEVISKTHEAWGAMDRLEEDLMNATLFLKGCRKDIVFQETPDGFEIQVVEKRNQSMEVLQNIPLYTEEAVSAYLGSGIRQGDFLILCNREEEKKVQLKVIRNNPRWNYHYLLFPEKISLTNPDLPSNLIKFETVSYRWKKSPEGGESLLRSYQGQESELLAGIESHEIKYDLKDEGRSYFLLNLTLNKKFPDGRPIVLRRNVPLESFQRLPRELENKVP